MSLPTNSAIAPATVAMGPTLRSRRGRYHFSRDSGGKGITLNGCETFSEDRLHTDIFIKLMSIREDPLFYKAAEVRFCAAEEVRFFMRHFITDEVPWSRYASIISFFVHVSSSSEAIIPATKYVTHCMEWRCPRGHWSTASRPKPPILILQTSDRLLPYPCIPVLPDSTCSIRLLHIDLICGPQS